MLPAEHQQHLVRVGIAQHQQVQRATLFGPPDHAATRDAAFDQSLLPLRERLDPDRRLSEHVQRMRAGIHRERGALLALCELLRRGRMPVLAVAAELGPVARLAVPVAELDAQRSFGFRRDREYGPGTRIDWHGLERSEEHTSELQSLMRNT